MRWCALSLVVGTVALACAPAPRGPEAFAGAALRTESNESGLVTAVHADGSGEPAQKGDFVELHYRAYLVDGTFVDGSHDGKPLGFLVLGSDEVIDGLEQGVVGMRERELRRITVPPRLGYQSRRVGAIPPDATLRFDVELMRIGRLGG